MAYVGTGGESLRDSERSERLRIVVYLFSCLGEGGGDDDRDG